MSCISVNLRRVNVSSASLRNVIEKCSTIDRIGGITVQTGREGGGKLRYHRIGGEASFSTERRGGLSARVGLVCTTGIKTITVLYVDEGPLLTIDKGYLIVR